MGSTLNSAADPAKAVRRDLVRIDEIELSGATFVGLEALAADYRWVNRRKGERVQGLLGFPLFRHILMSIDYPESQLILTVGELEASSDHVVSYRSGTRTPHVPVEIGGHELWPLLDTGSPGTIALSREGSETHRDVGAPGPLGHGTDRELVVPRLPRHVAR